MTEFTKGEWSYKEFDLEGMKRYWVQSEGEVDIGVILKESNARLVAAAPKMYERLKLVARLISRQAQGQLPDKIDPAIADTIYELLAKIDDEPEETMKYSSSFFQNRNCEYFPCHEVADIDKFSCLFCFCPLYHMKDCSGNPRWLSTGVKDCFGCTWPHTHYEEVIQVLREEAEHVQAVQTP